MLRARHLAFPLCFALLSACGPTAPTSPDDAAQPDATQPDAAQPDATQPDATQPDATQPDASPPNDRPPPPDATQPDAAPDVAQDASGGVCGTRGAPPCPSGTYCNRPISAMCGEADAPGTCTPIPRACPDIYMPVCGCDGRTYGNSCEAGAASVSVRATGMCPTADAGVDAAPDVASGVCGTRGAPACPAGQFCNYPVTAACGATDLGGTCSTPPTICNRIYMPVCGCDGRTYSNACEAAAARMSVRATGACPSADAGVDAGADAAADASMSCAAQSAMGVGVCALFFGYAWNGSACVGISGCSCSGSACGSLFTSPDACRSAYSRCDCRSVGCPSGRNCQACPTPGGVSYACIPNGAVC